jgi:16S rRNA processing protein RimM
MAEDYGYPAERYLLLGKITKAQGLRGEVKIFLHSGQPENLADYPELVLVDTSGNVSEPLAILKNRAQGKAAIVHLATISTRNAAEKIEGRGILLDRKHLPAVGDHEFYWHQYQGKLVVDVDDQVIGRVAHLFNNGAQDILVIKAGDEEILVPVTKSFVVGETADKLIIKPPPGLVELNGDSEN